MADVLRDSLGAKVGIRMALNKEAEFSEPAGNPLVQLP